MVRALNAHGLHDLSPYFSQALSESNFSKCSGIGGFPANARHHVAMKCLLTHQGSMFERLVNYVTRRLSLTEGGFAGQWVSPRTVSGNIRNDGLGPRDWNFCCRGLISVRSLLRNDSISVSLEHRFYRRKSLASWSASS